MSYLSSTDVKHQVRGVPTFTTVRQPDTWPGIDVLWRVDAEGQVAFDFQVDAAADHKLIRFKFDAPAQAILQSDGTIDVRLDSLRWRIGAPFAFESVGLLRLPITSSFVRDADGSFGIRLGRRTPGCPLTIDPTVYSFSTFVGSAGNDVVRDVALDASNNACVCGTTTQAPFLSGNIADGGGVAPSVQLGQTDIFVARFAPNGTLLTLTFVGSPANDFATAIAVSVDGGLYVSGYTDGTSFPQSAAPAIMPAPLSVPGATGGTSTDGVIFRLQPNGTTFDFSTYCCNGSATDSLHDIGIRTLSQSVDSIAVAGEVQTSSMAFPTGTPGNPLFVVLNANFLGLQRSATVVTFTFNKLTGALTPSWATHYGDPSMNTSASSVAIGATSGDVFIGGDSTNAAPQPPWTFPTVPVAGPQNSVSVALNGTSVASAYVARFAFNGTAVSTVFSAAFGGSTPIGPPNGNPDDYVFDISLDAAENLFVTGGTTSSDMPTTPGALQAAHADFGILAGATYDAFVGSMIYTPTPTPNLSFGFLTYLGGSTVAGSPVPGADDRGGAVAVDTLGNIHVSGDTRATDFPTLLPTQAQNAGSRDIFYTILNPQGSGLIYSSYLGGAGSDDSVQFGALAPTCGSGIAVNAVGTLAVVCGSTVSTNYPIVAAAQPTFGGGTDGVVTYQYSPDITVSPIPLNFGTLRLVNIPPTGLTKTIQVRNVGYAPLTFQSMTITAISGALGAWTVSNPTPVVIAPGGASPITVRFLPTTIGTYIIDVTYASDDVDEPTVVGRISAVVN